MSHSGEEAGHRIRQFLAVVAAREQVSVHIRSHDDRGVTKPFLNDLGWQGKATILLAVDEPACIEMPQRVKAGVSCLRS